MVSFRNGVCSECGAPIYIADRQLHIEFHEKIDELIDWAQAVSKNFAAANRMVTERPQKFGMNIPDTADKEWEPGDPIE